MTVIKGLQKTSLIDYVPYTAATIFLGGCNFRCRYCHNPELVLYSHLMPDISEKEIIDYLQSRKEWIDGVCITGGEPTMQNDLPEFIAKLKRIGMRIKLDTNGSNPRMIRKLLDMNLLDYIAMDVKTDLRHYQNICGNEIDISKIKQSIKLIRESGVEYEFRTTAVPSLVGKKEVFLIGKYLCKSKKFVLQNFRGTKEMIDKSLKGHKSYTKEELEEIVSLIKDCFEKVEVRE